MRGQRRFDRADQRDGIDRLLKQCEEHDAFPVHDERSRSLIGRTNYMCALATEATGCPALTCWHYGASTTAHANEGPALAAHEMHCLNCSDCSLPRKA